MDGEAGGSAGEEEDVPKGTRSTAQPVPYLVKRKSVELVSLYGFCFLSIYTVPHHVSS